KRIEVMLEKGEIEIYNCNEFSDIKEIGGGKHFLKLSMKIDNFYVETHVIEGSYGDVYSAKYRGEKIAFKKFIKPKDKILYNEVIS
ncbi:7654_t:CDS:1, partial [Gigaspora rosea]